MVIRAGPHDVPSHGIRSAIISHKAQLRYCAEVSQSPVGVVVKSADLEVERFTQRVGSNPVFLTTFSF